jgi:hypothetical protein
MVCQETFFCQPTIDPVPCDVVLLVDQFDEESIYAPSVFPCKQNVYVTARWFASRRVTLQDIEAHRRNDPQATT